MGTESLWGNLTVDEIADFETPVSILKSQAAQLSRITKNVVKANIDLISGDPSGQFRYDFDVVVPALDNYVYTLFRISHSMRLYPVRITVTHANPSYDLECEDRQAFVQTVESILSSERVHTIVRSLLAQAKAIR